MSAFTEVAEKWGKRANEYAAKGEKLAANVLTECMLDLAQAIMDNSLADAKNTD